MLFKTRGFTALQTSQMARARALQVLVFQGLIYFTADEFTIFKGPKATDITGKREKIPTVVQNQSVKNADSGPKSKREKMSTLDSRAFTVVHL